MTMRLNDTKRAFVKKRSKITASEVRKHVVSGLLPIHRLNDTENGFDTDFSLSSKISFTEPVSPIDIETLLEQRKTCLLYSISSPKSSKQMFEYAADDVEVKIVRQDKTIDYNFTTLPNIENHIRDICSFYIDDFSLVNRKHSHYGTEDVKHRWNLEKLTALHQLRPQIFQSGLKVMFRIPSTISLEGTSFDDDREKDAKNNVAKIKIASIDKNVLLDTLLEKNRVKHIMNCIHSDDKDTKLEKRAIPQLPEEEEPPKMFVKIEKTTVEPFFEPLFVSMAVYDVRQKVKVTETAYFNIIDNDKLDMLGRFQPNNVSKNMQFLFSITGPVADMFLVIKIDKVLQQCDVFEGSEPYTGTKEEKNVEKLKSNAEDYCQRLGAYRTPLGFQILDIQKIFNANTQSICLTDRRTDPMIISSCTINSGVAIYPSGQTSDDRCSIASADRNSITSMSSTLRRFGSGTSAATVFSRVRTPLSKRKFNFKTEQLSESRGEIPDSLENMSSYSLKFSNFFRYENDKLSEEDIFRFCSEVRRTNGKLNRKMFNLEMELTVAGSNKSKEYVNHGSTATINCDSVPNELMEINRYKPSLYKSYKNVLYIYPKHINLSNRAGNVRNIMIKVEIMDSNEIAQHLIYDKGSYNKDKMLKFYTTNVIYHNRSPHFTDEIKVDLPCDLNDGHHILFTIYHISCKDSDCSSSETPVGYSWIPLYRNGKIRSGDFYIPVCGEKPPQRYGYLDPNNALPNLKWIDSHRPLFHVSLKALSTVHPQDDYLERFFSNVASLSSTNPKNPPVRESDLITSIENLLKASPERLVSFIHFIISRLLFLIANPPYSSEVSLKSFEIIGHLVKLFSKMLDTDVDYYLRSMLLASFIRYRKIANQESKPHSIIRPVELKQSPTDSNMIINMIEHVEKSTGGASVSVTNVRLHEMLVEIWLSVKGTARDISVVYSWFFLETIIKSASEYLTMTGRMFSSRKIRFGDQFLKNIETLIQSLTNDVLIRSASDFDEARQISSALAFFLRDCFSIMDRTYTLKLVHKYMVAFSDHMKKPGTSLDVLSIKFDFLKILCSYEHFLIINILNDTEITEGKPNSAAPPKSSLSTSAQLKNISSNWALTDQMRATHYFSGQLLSDLRDSLKSGNSTLCAKVIETIKELMQSHELDNRLCDNEPIAQVAHIYKPLVIIVLQNLDCFFCGSVRNSSDGSSNMSFLESTLKQDVMTAISGRLSTSGESHVSRFQLDFSTTRSLLCAMFWVLKNVSDVELKSWIVSLNEENMMKLLQVLYYTMTTFEIKEELTCNRYSLDKNQLQKLEDDAPAAEVKWRTRSTETSDSKQENSPEQETLTNEAIVSCEMFFCVVEIIETIIASSAESKNSACHLLLMVFPIIVHGFSCNVSDQVLEVLFAAQQRFFAKFPGLILEQKPELCADLSQQILRYCSSTNIESVRTMATISLYHFMRENFKLYKNLTRARTFLSTALSTLLSGSFHLNASVNDEFMIKSLEVANQLAVEDDTFDESTKTKLIEQMKELTANLQKIMLSTVRMREHVNDYEMTIDLMYQLVEGYSNNPDLRITWLLNMAERHEKQRNLCEAAHSYLQACALVFEYIDQSDQNLPFVSYGASTFSEISPNVFKESKVDFNSVKNDGDNHIQSYHFTEAGLLKILEKTFTILEKAQLYELLFPFSKVLLEYYHAVKSFSKASYIHKRLSIAAEQIKETNEFREYQSDAWVSPLPGIDKRCFGTFFRVAFYGKCFKELQNQEFVYKESAFSKLNEISNRLESFYLNMFGDGNVIVLKDSRQVDVSQLNPDKGYIQITFVDVYLSNDEKMERSTYFERRNNVSRFYFETPYTMEGRAQGDLPIQYKKRTILTVENSFPYVKTRLKVVNRSVVNFSPIEVAIEDIEKKTRELAAAIQQKNPKILSMLVQGAIGTTVNQGPLEIANVFLANAMTDDKGKPMDRLQNKLRLSFRHLQYRAMEAIQLLRQLIGEDQKEYQENVESNFNSFVLHLKPMITRTKGEISFSEFSKATVV